MKLNQQIHAFIYPGDQSGYVAECQEIAVVTQGSTLDEVTQNLREAVALYLEDEDPNLLGFTDKPSLIVTFELQPEYA
jgi:predicted RNase H-like HicB family nuclease